jgi:hypothetical protein
MPESHSLEIAHDTLPFHLGPLKIYQQADGSPGRLQIIDALRRMLAGELIHAL